MAQRSRLGSGSSGGRTSRGERVTRVPKNVDDSVRDMIKSWFDVQDTDDIPSKVWGMRGYVAFIKNGPSLAQWEVWAKNYTNQIHKSLMHLWLYHASYRGSRGQISSTQDARIADYLLANWDSLLANNSNLLDGSKEADKDLESLVNEPLPTIDHKDVIASAGKVIVKEATKAPPVKTPEAQPKAVEPVKAKATTE